MFDTVDGAVGTGSTIVAQTTGRLEERVADLDTFLTDARAVAASATRARRPWPSGRRPSPTGSARSATAGCASARASTPPWRRSPRSIARCPSSTCPTARPRSWPRSISASPTSTPTSRPSGPASTTRVSNVVEGATALRGAVDRVSEVGTRIETGLAAVEDRIDRAQATIETVMWLTTAVLLAARRLRRPAQRPDHPRLPPLDQSAADSPRTLRSAGDDVAVPAAVVHAVAVGLG